jgi:hypothetical protein
MVVPEASLTGNSTTTPSSTKRATEFTLEMPAGSPAGVDVAAQFRDIIRMCWRQRELKRPRAESVHKRLLELMSHCRAAPSAAPSQRPSLNFSRGSLSKSRNNLADAETERQQRFR